MAFFRRLGKLEVQVAADTSGFTKGMRTVNRVVDGVRGSLNRFTQMASGVAGAFGRIAAKASALSAAIAGGTFTALTIQAFRTTGALSRMSRQLGVTVADLARARHATLLAGEGTKLFDSRIRRLSSQLRNAGAKAGVFKSAIQEWVKETAKGGGEADRFGLVVDDAFARMVERANVSAQRLREAFVGRFRQIAVAISPFVEFATEKLTEFVTVGTTDLKLVDKAMGFVRDTTADFLDLLEGSRRKWLEWKVIALEALTDVAKAVAKPVSKFKGLRNDAIDFWSQIFVGKGNVKFREDEPEAPGSLLNILSKALADARINLRKFDELGEKPKWAERFTGWWDKLIKDAKDRMKEFMKTTKPPKLKDFKLPGIETRLAPSIAVGSVAAQQASFRAQGQQESMGQQLAALVRYAQQQQGGDEKRAGLLFDIRRALENKRVITMGA